MRYLLLALTLPLAAQTNILIGTTPLQTGVKRLGINLGGQNYYDSGQLLKNLVLRNPGFEKTLWQSTVQCANGSSAGTCVDTYIYGGWTTGFWPAGTPVNVLTGAAVNCQASLISYGGSPGPPNNGNNTFRFGPFSLSSGAPPGAACNKSATLSAGDWIALGPQLVPSITRSDNKYFIGGWSNSVTGTASFASDTSDLPPGTTGQQALAMNAPAPGDVAHLFSQFDSCCYALGVTKSFINLNGTFQIQFKAKGVSGSQKVQLSFDRGGGTVYLPPVTISLTPNWATYTQLFTAAENGTQKGTVTLHIQTVDAPDSLYIDDVSLTQTGDSNPTQFRDPVIAALNALKPGVIRMWDGADLGNTLDNLLNDQFGRKPSNYTANLAFPSDAAQPIYYYNDVGYGLFDFLQACLTIQSATGSLEPWIVVPITTTPQEASNWIDYLSGGPATVYGAKRIAQGQKAPWTSVFPLIHLEYGNESWNSTFQGGNLLGHVAYGKRANAVFAAMKGNQNFNPDHTSLVLNGWTAVPSYTQTSQAQTTLNDEVDMTIYLMSNLTDPNPANLFPSTLADAQAYWSSDANCLSEGHGADHYTVAGVQNAAVNGCLGFHNINAEANTAAHKKVAVYEANNGTNTIAGMPNPQAVLNSYVSSLGMALSLTNAELNGMANGVLTQNLFTLPQYYTNIQGGYAVFDWGTVIDMGGPTNSKRPQFLAEQITNAAISPGATMLRTTRSGDNPHYIQQSSNGVALNPAYYLQSYAFDNGGGLKSVILFNTSLTTALPVTFSGPNAPPAGVTLSQTTLTSAKVSDTNESGDLVKPVTTLLPNFNPASGLLLPPYSEVVLQYSTTITPSGPR